MEQELRTYHKYKNDIIYLLAVSGLWPDYKRYPKFVKNFLTCFAVTAVLSTAFGIVNFCLHNLTNIIILTKGLSLMISYTSAVFKVLILTFNRNNLTKLNRNLSDQFEKDLQVAENRPHLLAYCRSFHRYFRLHYYGSGWMLLLLVIGPLLALRHGKYVRAFPQLVPFDYKNGGIAHWGTYAFEVAEGYFGWTNTVGPDSVFGLYALHMVGEYRLLATRFRNLKSGRNYQQQLKECVDRHVTLIELKQVMQQVFGFLSVWLAVTCAIVICAIIFQTSQMQNLTPIKICYLTIYCGVKFNQAYTYAWFGHVINLESEACINSIYDAEWEGRGDVKLMKDALIILSQRPMQFEALGIMIVRLDMFSKIMNTSVSYFFLLKTLDENQAMT